MPTLKPQSYASVLDFAIKSDDDGGSLAEHFDLQHNHAGYLFSSLPDGDNSLDYVSCSAMRYQTVIADKMCCLQAYPSYVSTYSRKLSSPWAEMAILHTGAIIALRVSSLALLSNSS